MQMDEKTLSRIVSSFESTLETFRSGDKEDNRIFAIYAEYLVALKLAQRGFSAKVVNKRSYDILLNDDLAIEVKTGKYEDGCAGASFGKGKQIEDVKFDYCVFLTYNNLRVKETLIFSRKELEEVALKPRGSSVVQYPKTNPCIFLRYDSLEEYLRSLQESERLDIEVELHRHPEKFVDRWDKIKKL
jgi:hypothetical protein